MSAPLSLEDTMRRHDAAVYDWLGTLRVDYGAHPDVHELTPIDRNNFPILRVFAAPDRCVAQVVDLLSKTGWIAGNDPGLIAANAETLRQRATDNFAILPLPLVTIVRNDPTTNLADSGVPKVFRRQRFDQAAQTFERHQWPGAYETTYGVTFWSLKRYTEAYFREWVKSQLGIIGTAENELLLPVRHEMPWGTIRQRLVFEGSNDLSDLEGDGTRYIRAEFTFRLRTWHFRAPLGTTSYVHDVALSERSIAHGERSEDLADANPSPSPVSLNLFSIYMPANRIPSAWPKSGDATVRRATGGGLRMTVEAPADEVLISNRAVPLDNRNRAVLSLALSYQSSALARVLIAARDPNVAPVTWIPARRFDLPTRGSFTTAQFFTLIDQPIYSATVQGAGSPSIVYLRDVSLVHVRTLTRVAPTTSTPGVGQTVHAWSGLGTGAHLVVVAFDAGATADTILVGATPYAVDPALQIGLVALITPVAGALSVTVPDTIPVDDIYVHPFLGSWRGTDV